MGKSNKITQEYLSKFGTLSTRRGRDEKKKALFSWEAIPECTDEDCPLRDKCHYVKRSEKCQVVAGFTKAAATNIITNYGSQMSNPVRNRVGTHLMPLYVQLARMYVYEASLGSVHFVDNKGNPKVNPIYKDIRDTIRSIDLQWKNLGLMELQIDGNGEEEEDFSNYYTNMEKKDMKVLELRNKKKEKQKIRILKKKEG